MTWLLSISLADQLVEPGFPMHRIKGLPYKVSRVPTSSKVKVDDFSIFKWV